MCLLDIMLDAAVSGGLLKDLVSKEIFDNGKCLIFGGVDPDTFEGFSTPLKIHYWDGKQQFHLSLTIQVFCQAHP